MKKFVFSLDRVLDFKQQTLDVKKNQLATLQLQLREMEQNIADLNEKFTLTNRKMVQEMQIGLTAHEISNYKLYFEVLNKNIKKLTVEKERLENIIVEKKAEIVQLNSDISGFEKLKEKQFEEYMKAYRKNEELAIEEFVSQKNAAG